jgi:hypothetical protein
LETLAVIRIQAARHCSGDPGDSRRPRRRRHQDAARQEVRHHSRPQRSPQAAILYKTTREFLIHFGLKDIAELPSMEEFEELIKNQAAAEEEIPEEV